MKVLYANHIFSDYRIPFYKELNRLFQGNFFVMYSPLRYTMSGNSQLLEKVRKQLKDFSYEYNGEKIKFIRKPFNKDFDSYYQIPVMRGFEKALAKYKPDIIISEGFFQWTPMVAWYSWKKQIPMYIGYERTTHTERFAPFYKIWERKFIDKFVTGYLINGTETRKYLLSLGIKDSKIHIAGMNADGEGLRNGISSITIECKKKIKETLNIKKNGITYLYSGQFIPRKGIIHLLNAWETHIKSYPDDSLILIGGGELLEEYKKKFSNIKSIHILGKIPYDNVFQYYAISDVFVIPTLEDNWCLVVPEAMSCGLPIACSKYNGGAIDLIKEGENGTIFDPLNKESMLNALSFFHGKDLKLMGKRSIELEEPWNTINCARRMYDAIVKDYTQRRKNK